MAWGEIHVKPDEATERGFSGEGAEPSGGGSWRGLGRGSRKHLQF